MADYDYLKYIYIYYKFIDKEYKMSEEEIER